MISMIVAITDRNVIGKDGDQPVYISADLRRFKKLTTGHTVIMGRKTFVAIMSRLGKPLPNRTNIVISRTLEPSEDYTVARSLEEALAHAEAAEETFIIGGGTIYKEAFDRADKIYLTQVDAGVEGDVYFPTINPTDWEETAKEDFLADDKNPYNYSWITLERKRA